MQLATVTGTLIAAHKYPGLKGIKLFIIQRHGAVIVGKDIWEAYLNREKLENVAEISFKLRQIGREMPFPSGVVEKLIDKRDQHGLMAPGQRQEIAAACGVCQLSERCPQAR